MGWAGMIDGLTEEEVAYTHQFKPAGFLRTWNAIYSAKCRRQWRLGILTWAALEKRNRRPTASTTTFGPYLGWSFSVPLGIGTLMVWGYRRIAGWDGPE